MRDLSQGQSTGAVDLSADDAPAESCNVTFEREMLQDRNHRARLRFRPAPGTGS